MHREVHKSEREWSLTAPRSQEMGLGCGSSLSMDKPGMIERCSGEEFERQME